MVVDDACLQPPFSLPIVLVAMACLSGCGPGHAKTYPVSGKVLFGDGTPLTTGGAIHCESVVTEGLPVNARGAIRADGTFVLSTFADGDGAVSGKHRVLVRAQRDAVDYRKEEDVIPKPIIEPRFERYETSGLEFTVKEGNNDFTVVVERPGRPSNRR